MKLFLLIPALSFASAVTALSPEEIEQYRAGAGMGYATERLMQAHLRGYGSSATQHQHRKH